MMDASFQKKSDVLILGGGIVGLSTAIGLARAGTGRIHVLDQAQVGSGCSFGNAGWLTPCFSMPLPQPGLFWKSLRWMLDSESPLYVHPEFSLELLRWLQRFLFSMTKKHLEMSVEILTALSVETLEGFLQLGAMPSAEKLAGGFGLTQAGLLMLASTKDGVNATLREQELVARFGIPGRFLSADEILGFEPALARRSSSRQTILGGVHFTSDAHVDPYLAVQRLKQEALSLGVEIEENTTVLKWIQGEGGGSHHWHGGQKVHAVLTSRGLRTSENFVLATGSWSQDLVRDLRVRVPIRGGKGYSILIDPIADMPRVPIMILEKKIAITPHAGSLRLAGTLELVKDDMQINWRRLRAIMQGASDYLELDPELGPHVQNIWRGLRPCTPDGLPMIGFSRRIPNLFLCAGHQMLGLQSSLGSGRLAAKMILGQSVPKWTHALRVDRF